MALTGVTYVADLAANEFYNPYEGIELGGITATNLPVLPDTGFRIRGKRMPHGVKTALYGIFTCNPDVASVTAFAAVLRLALPVSAKNADIVNTAARFDVALKILTSASSVFDDASIGTAVAGTATMGTALGTFASVSIGSITSGSVTAGSVALIRIRRLGDAAADTNLGDVIFLGCSLTAAAS